MKQIEMAHFFTPRSIAVIGTFQEGIFGGFVVVKSLMNAGYSGKIYPVNPGYQEVFGYKVYPSVTEVRDGIDLALIMVNARNVPRIMRECGEKGIRAVVLVSDGFAERDREGAELQREVQKITAQYGIRVIGPNTAGVANSENGFNPCPYEAGYYRWKRGGITICSQTGIVNPQAFPFQDLGLGVNKICDFGNKSDVDECDILEYLAEDPSTRVISLYLESVRDGNRFIRAAKRVTARKPVLVFKAGKTVEGARASSSHTGSLAVDYKIFEAACRQAGVLLLDEFDELFEMPKVFDLQPLPAGRRLGILTITGAVGVLATDRAPEYGMEISQLTPATSRMLRDLFPGLGMMPVDIGPMVPALNNLFEVYPRVVDAIMADENVDALLNVVYAEASKFFHPAFLDGYRAIRGRYRKPVVTWIYGPNLEGIAEMAGEIEDMGFPVFKSPERAIKALGLAYRYAQRG